MRSSFKLCTVEFNNRKPCLTAKHKTQGKLLLVYRVFHYSQFNSRWKVKWSSRAEKARPWAKCLYKKRGKKTCESFSSPNQKCAGSGSENMHSPDHILSADGAFAHALAALCARDHVSTFQKYTVDWRVHADLTHVFFQGGCCWRICI